MTAGRFDSSIRLPSAYLTHVQYTGRSALAALAVTPDGVVFVWMQRRHKRALPSTAMQTAANGRYYYRRVFRSFTERGLLTVARRFAREVAS